VRKPGHVVAGSGAISAKLKSRYATLGFTDKAKLDDGAMWPTGVALKVDCRRTE
jgi:hypothetical protein